MNDHAFVIIWAIITLSILFIIFITWFEVGDDKFKNHFRKISTGFFKEEDTVHEPILFFISNASIITFLAVLSQYIIDGKVSVLRDYFIPELLLYFLYIIIVYILLITVARILTTLFNREVRSALIWFVLTIVIGVIILFVKLSI